MRPDGLRVAVIGATGALGSEVLAVLSESSLAVRELHPVATDESLGKSIDFQGEEFPVLTEAPPLRGIDWLFLCAPPEVSREFARDALRAEVRCIDLSGALAASPEISLAVAAHRELAPGEAEPLVVTPSGPALAAALVLRPLHEAASLRRVTGSLLEAASSSGRQGIEALYGESMAIVSQRDLPEPDVFGRPVAFDCLPAMGEPGESGQTAREGAIADEVGRLLGADSLLALTAIQVPIFVGAAAALTVETEQPLSPGAAAAALEKAPGVELWQGEASGVTMRAAVGRDVVLVGRIRPDPTTERALQLWLAADVLRLSAANAVALAEQATTRPLRH